jgi:hypothetical protein
LTFNPTFQPVFQPISAPTRRLFIFFPPKGDSRGYSTRHESKWASLYRGFITGGQGQNRTADTKIFSLLLYRLSYLPTVAPRR